MREEVRNTLNGAVIMINACHLHNGVQSEGGECALALAIDDALPQIGNVEVDYKVTYLWSSNRRIDECSLQVIMSKKVSDFTQEFDDGVYEDSPEWVSKMAVIYKVTTDEDIPYFWAIDFVDGIEDDDNKMEAFEEHFKEFETYYERWWKYAEAE